MSRRDPNSSDGGREFMTRPELIFPATVRVTEQEIDLSGFSPRQKAFYLDLFWRLVAFYQSWNQPRGIIGIAGPTGAGKSVVAVLFKELAKQAGLPFAFEAITIDAYHYPNRFLRSHFSDGEPLKQVKGRFDTYDVAALVRDLKAFAAGKSVSFPVYSRKLHDPVADGVVVTDKPALLIVEGLWLLYEQAGWEQVGPRLDFSLFIESDPEKTREPVIRRHMTGGRTLADAVRHYEQVDGWNSDLVLTTKSKADQVIPPYYSV
jgi:pantothenate kinase